MNSLKPLNDNLETFNIDITWNGNQENVFIINNFPNYNKKLRLNENKNNKKEKIISLKLPIGTYFYQYEINGKITIDKNKENNGKYNILTINDENEYEYEKLKDIVLKNNPPDLFPDNFFIQSILMESNNNDKNNIEKPNNKKESSNIPIKLNLLKSNRERINSNSLFENSINFSIKAENVIQDIEIEKNNITKVSQNFTNANLKFPIVIIYNLNHDYLIPMYLSDEKNNLVKLRYLDAETEIILKKNDLSYSTIDSLIPIGNLVDLNCDNKLSILKNIQYRIKTDQPFIYISKMLILFNYKYNKNDNKERDFFLKEFILPREKKYNLFLSNCKTSNLILKKFIELNNYQTYYRELYLIDSIIKLIKSIKTKVLLVYKSSLGFELIPLLSSNIRKNILYSKSLIFYESNQELDKSIKLNIPQYILTKILYNDYTKEIFNLFCNNKSNIIIINKIYNILSDNKNEFKNIFKLLLLSYIFFNYKEIGKEYFVNSKLHGNKIMMKAKVFMNIITGENMIFYSNLLLLILIKYLILVINIKLKRYKTDNKNALFIFFNSFQKNDDEKLLNNSIIRRCNLNYKIGENIKDDDLIVKYINYFYNENLSQFNQNLTENDKTFIAILKSNFDLDFLYMHNQNNIEKENLFSLFKIFLNNSIDNIKKIEVKNINNIKQIVNYNFPNGNFDEFIKNKELIHQFFEMTQINDFIKLYKKKNEYFRNYTMKEFFNYFLPILSDIDKSYNNNKIQEYTNKINNYLIDLQNYQKINEKYAIKNENIYINFRTFEILILLLFNVYEEKAKIIQKSFLHKYLKNGIFNNFKLKVIKIQRAFKLFLLNKYKKKSNDEIIDLILKKYKGNDPKLILLIINSKKLIDYLQRENLKLRGKLKSSSITLYKKKQDIRQENKKKITLNKQNKNNKEEIENLKLQLNEATAKYYESVGIIMEYERRMKNFIQSICSNQKVKDVLIKNGIQIN